MDSSDPDFMGTLMAVMYRGMEQSLLRRRSFTLTLTLIRILLGFFFDTRTVFETDRITVGPTPTG